MSTDSIKTCLYNPLDRDFVWPYLDEKNEADIAIVPSHEISYYKPWLTTLLAKHIVDEILNIRGVKTNHEDESKALLNEVLIKL